MRQLALNRFPMSDATQALISANSTVANFYEVTLASGESFLSPDGTMVHEAVIRNERLGSHERTIRRH